MGATAGVASNKFFHEFLNLLKFVVRQSLVIEPTISEIEEVNYCNANADWFINTSITAKEENLSLGYVETRKARNKDENQHDEKIIIL
jgi:hypothetical protein